MIVMQCLHFMCFMRGLKVHFPLDLRLILICNLAGMSQSRQSYRLWLVYTVWIKRQCSTVSHEVHQQSAGIPCFFFPFGSEALLRSTEGSHPLGSCRREESSYLSGALSKGFMCERMLLQCLPEYTVFLSNCAPFTASVHRHMDGIFTLFDSLFEFLFFLFSPLQNCVHYVTDTLP